MSPALPDFLMPLSGARIAGRYVLDRTLGEGGMGVVVEAAYPELDQRVAIKFMRPELAANAGISARFLREAKLAARVKSPHFVRVYDVGKTEPPATQVPYIVMEMLTGRDLGDELAARGALPIEEAVDYVLQACAGIAEIHSFGVVHRDLKPSNLFLAEQAGSRLVKVLDFGVSKDVVKDGETNVQPPVTATNGPVGTPHYMSPEQVRESKSVDGRSDVWAMGVVLYELLTQTLPFLPAEGGTGEVFGMILFARPEKPSTYRMEMPEGLEDLILKCLERDRNLRYSSILELAEALRPFAAASSLHRISMVRDALSHRPQPSTSDLSGLSPEHSHAATIPLTPSSKREGARLSLDTATAISEPKLASTPDSNRPTSPQGAARSSGPPNPNHPTSFTSMTDTMAPGLASGARARRRTALMFVTAATAFLLAGVVFFETNHAPPLATPASSPSSSSSGASSSSVALPPSVPQALDLSAMPALDAAAPSLTTEDAAAPVTQASAAPSHASPTSSSNPANVTSLLVNASHEPKKPPVHPPKPPPTSDDTPNLLDDRK